MTLALFGGEPVRRKLYPPHQTIGDEERRAVLSVLDSGLLSGFVAGDTEEFLGGPQVRTLEERFCERFGVRYAVAFNSGTSALHASLAAAGVGPGDEVITSPYTMSASATTVIMQNAVPVFVDVEPRTFCLNADLTEQAVSSRTKAIIAVNLFGQPAALAPLRDLATRRGLILIEDNAQSPGALYHGREAGTVGHMGVFSLNRHKTIQCGEGGVVTTNDVRFADRLQLIRNHGETVVETRGRPEFFSIIGWNYRMTELQAAVAVAQLDKLDRLNDRRVRLATHLTGRLKGCRFIEPPAVRDGCSHVYYTYAMTFRSEAWGIPREVVAQALAAEGIPVGNGYAKPLYLLPLYRSGPGTAASGCAMNCPRYDGRAEYREGLCPVAERLFRSDVLTTNICRFPATTADIDDCVQALEKVFAHRAELFAVV